MKSRVFAAVLAMVLASVFYATAQAEDIDIFDKNPSNKDAPSVLLILDTAGASNASIDQLCTTNLGSKVTHMMVEVLNALIDPSNSYGFNPANCPPLTDAQKAEYLQTVQGINLGLGLFNDPNKSGGVKGGYVRYDIRSMNTADYRKTLLEKINNCSTTSPVCTDCTDSCKLYTPQYMLYEPEITLYEPTCTIKTTQTTGPHSSCNSNNCAGTCSGSGNQKYCTVEKTESIACNSTSCISPSCTATYSTKSVTSHDFCGNRYSESTGPYYPYCTEQYFAGEAAESASCTKYEASTTHPYEPYCAEAYSTGTTTECSGCTNYTASTESPLLPYCSKTSSCSTVANCDDPNGTCSCTSTSTDCAYLPDGGNAPYAKSMYEAHQLFEGGRNFAGFFSDQYDSAACGATAETDIPLVMGSKCGYEDKYESAIKGVECPKKYIIFVGTGTPDGAESKDAFDLLGKTAVSPKSGVTNAPALGYNTTSIDLGLSGGDESYINEYARELWKNKSIHTYTIMARQPDNASGTGCMGVFKNKPIQAACKILQNAAEVGGGRFFLATDAQKFLDALNAIFTEIIADNSVFASTALPVSVNVRGTFLNEVYIGMFRPDANKLSRWFGNMKLYQLAVNSSNNVFLADKNGKSADDPNTGFITSTATSFWSEDSTFWTFRQLLGAPYGSSYNGSDVPDGAEVEKGGAAQQIRLSYPTSVGNQTTRKLYTYTTTPAATSAVTLSGTTDTNTQFNTSNTAITAASLGLGAATEEARTALINWVRGDNNVPELANRDSSGSLVYAVRPSVHGDVLHSDPVVVNYGGDNNIVVYYGANDGIFHAVKGGKTGTTAGDELWGLVLPEHFNKLKRLYDNGEYSTVYNAANPRPYFVDGGVGLLFRDELKSSTGGGDDVAGQDGVPEKVNLFLSMRRGGRFIYALDVTDQAAPKFLWRRGCGTIDATSTAPCSTRYDELGQTWSKINAAKLNLKKDDTTTEAVNVVIFGGGYDPAANDASAASGTATMGRAIFVVNAGTGEVIWQASPRDVPTGTNGQKVGGMLYSIPSEVTVLDTDGNGYADRLYVGDTGGQVWRVDIADTDPSQWTIRLLASVGGTVVAADGTKTNWPGSGDKSTGTYYPRKFMYLPDIVLRQKDSTGEYDAVLIGSGDREHPFDKNVVNRFYMFKDRGGSQATINEGDIYDATENAIQDGTDAQKTAAKTALDAASGWYVTLGTGEKVVGSAITLAGATFFNTNQPKPDTGASADGCVKAKADRSGSLTIPQCTTDLGVACAYALSFLNAGAIVNRVGSSTLTKEDRVDVLVAGGFPPSPTAAIVMLDNPNDSTGELRPYQTIISGSRVEEPPKVKLDKRHPVYWFQKDANY